MHRTRTTTIPRIWTPLGTVDSADAGAAITYMNAVAHQYDMQHGRHAYATVTSVEEQDRLVTQACRHLLPDERITDALIAYVAGRVLTHAIDAVFDAVDTCTEQIWNEIGGNL